MEYPGAYYHVMNWGNRGEDIFLTSEDRKVFLAGLADSCETHHIKLIAYVLMTNHFHLLVEIPQTNLSESMRHFIVAYTVRFNLRNVRTGHVFLSELQALRSGFVVHPLSRLVSRFTYFLISLIKKYDNTEKGQIL